MPHDASQPEPTSASLDEELVAYLDGELGAEGRRRLEQQLASDPEVRQKLQQLEQTWQLLDQLEHCEVDEGFTRSTLEMVAVAAEEEVCQVESRSRRRRRWLLGTGGLVAAAAAGFLVVMLLRPDPNRKLLEDLPVLENYDEYRQVGDIDFLRELDRQGLFIQEQHDGS